MKFENYLSEAYDFRKNKRALDFIRKSRSLDDTTSIERVFSEAYMTIAEEDDTLSPKDIKDVLMMIAEDAIDTAINQ